MSNNINRISNPSIVRLARKAGILSVSQDISIFVRNTILVKLEKLLKIALILLNSSERRTLKEEDVRQALNRIGKKVYGSEIPYEACKILSIPKTKKPRKKGAIAKMEVKFYQKQTGFILAKGPFQSVVREIQQDYMTGSRCSAHSLTLIQTYIESELHKLLLFSKKIAAHANRSTVNEKDCKLAEQGCK